MTLNKRLVHKVSTVLYVAALALATNHEYATAQENLQSLEEAAMQAAVNRVADAVVRIETIGGAERVGKFVVSSGPTTGLIVDKDGFIISSSFNFIQNPSTIFVTLPGGERTTAKIVAKDVSRKLVLLKVETAAELPVPDAAKKESFQVGQWSVALGRTFSEDSPNLSVGIVSALNRVWSKALQTDAKISPLNYGGPLIDIHGRVLGVLVPMSPQDTDEVAGTEWYDSGIGFAIPFEDILANLPAMKRGETIRPGLMGVTLKGANVFADKAIVLNCAPTSPAAEAGILPGDEVVAIDSTEIQRQAQMKHALGNRNAGETIKVTVLRDGERIERELQLAAEILPFDQPFLGILPDRTAADGAGVTARYVFADSPAAKAGMKAGDVLTEFSGQKVESVSSLLQQLRTTQAGTAITIGYTHNNEQVVREIQAAAVSLEIPADLPVPRLTDGAEKPLKVETGLIDVKIVGEENVCVALVPENVADFPNLGLVVWLQPPGELKKESVKERWGEICKSQGLIVLVPQPLDKTTWSATEIDFIRKAIEDVAGKYPVDARRIVAYGEKAGGSFGFLVAFAHRDLIRGVVSLDGALPARMRVPDVEPNYPLSIYWAELEENDESPFEAMVDALKQKKFPVISKRGTAAAELQTEIFNWIDSLDRI